MTEGKDHRSRSRVEVLGRNARSVGRFDVETGSMVVCLLVLFATAKMDQLGCPFTNKP